VGGRKGYKLQETKQGAWEMDATKEGNKMKAQKE